MQTQREMNVNRCEKHPEYSGEKAPEINCEACWDLYLGEEPEKTVIQVRREEVDEQLGGQASL